MLKGKKNASLGIECISERTQPSESATSTNRSDSAHVNQGLDRGTSSQAGDLQTAWDGIEVCACAHGAFFLGGTGPQLPQAFQRGA